MENLPCGANPESCAQVRGAAAFPFEDGAWAVYSDGAGVENKEVTGG